MTVAAPPVIKLTNYINGRWTDSQAPEWRDVINPATGEILAQVPLAEAAEVNQAVDAALRDSAEGFTQALTATRDAYLFTLAQDLRNPLSAIHVASSVLARPDFGPEIRRNSTRRVRAALTPMDGLVSELL